MSKLLQPRESLTVDFKSDLEKLPDRELIEALACLANAEGGKPWLGSVCNIQCQEVML